MHEVGTQPPTKPPPRHTPRDGVHNPRPHIDMATIVLSTFALLGCAFLVYVWFQWLREELDLKQPAHRDRSRL